jgi:uncharacterized protein
MSTPTLTPVTQEEFVHGVRAIAGLLAADADWTADFVIGVGRGGLTVGVYLSHAANLPMLSVDFSSQVPDFAAEPLVKLARYTREGKRLLFVDDINDSGRTIAHLRAELKAAGVADGHVRFATLMDNIRSAERVDYAARTIDRSVTKDWFVFPWEAVAPTDQIIEDSAAVPERIG